MPPHIPLRSATIQLATIIEGINMGCDINIPIATGDQLDKIAELWGVKRNPSESDYSLRNRIQSNATAGIIYIKDPSPVDFIVTDLTLEKKPICECGKEKFGFSAHERWCPKYEKFI